jgi:hypothetical protein
LFFSSQANALPLPFARAVLVTEKARTLFSPAMITGHKANNGNPRTGFTTTCPSGNHQSRLFQVFPLREFFPPFARVHSPNPCEDDNRDRNHCYCFAVMRIVTAPGRTSAQLATPWQLSVYQ